MPLDAFLAMEKSQSLSKRLFSEKFVVSHQIGKGSFGRVYKVLSKADPPHPFAAKMAFDSGSDLEKEAKILKSLGNEQGFPRLKDYFKDSKQEILVMSLLGSNIRHLHHGCLEEFSLKTVILLALQSLKRIEALHKQGMVHRDIKPENLVMGNSHSDEKTLYLIDFGLAVSYLDKLGKHVPFRKNGNAAGTLSYLSVFGHLGIQASRRDDLISLGYVLIHLRKGSLPWMRVYGEDREKVKKIFHMKSTMSHEKLCKGLPCEFVDYFKYVSTLPFGQKPNYEYLSGLFKNMLDDLKEEEDGIFDWMEIEKERKGIDLQGRKIMNEGLNKYRKKVEDLDSFVDLDFL